MTPHILLICSSVSTNVILDRDKLHTAGVLTTIMGTISSTLPDHKHILNLCMPVSSFCMCLQRKRLNHSFSHLDLGLDRIKRFAHVIGHFGKKEFAKTIGVNMKLTK